MHSGGGAGDAGASTSPQRAHRTSRSQLRRRAGRPCVGVGLPPPSPRRARVFAQRHAASGPDGGPVSALPPHRDGCSARAPPAVRGSSPPWLGTSVSAALVPAPRPDSPASSLAAGPRLRTSAPLRRLESAPAARSAAAASRAPVVRAPCARVAALLGGGCARRAAPQRRWPFTACGGPHRGGGARFGSAFRHARSRTLAEARPEPALYGNRSRTRPGAPEALPNARAWVEPRGRPGGGRARGGLERFPTAGAARAGVVRRPLTLAQRARRPRGGAWPGGSAFGRTWMQALEAAAQRLRVRNFTFPSPYAPRESRAAARASHTARGCKLGARRGCGAVERWSAPSRGEGDGSPMPRARGLLYSAAAEARGGRTNAEKTRRGPLAEASIERCSSRRRRLK